MAAKPFHKLYAAFLMLVVFQPFVVESTLSKFKSIQNIQQSQKGDTVKGLHKVKQYLYTLGYYSHETNPSDDHFDDALETGLKAFQAKYNLTVIGKLDSDTIKTVSIPRTSNGTKGTHDNDHGTSRLVSNYAFFPNSPRWDYTQLTYGFPSNYNLPYGVSFSALRSIMAEAFGKWANANSRFSFQEVTSASQANIKIAFDYLDGYGGREYARGYAPPNGWIIFDIQERWSVNNPARDQVDLRSVALHEIGHALGLWHSEDRNAAMFAFLNMGDTKRNLAQDDINGLAALYCCY